MTVLGLARLLAIGNYLGGLLSEWLNPSPNFVNCALHALEWIILTKQGRANDVPWSPISFLLGYALFLLVSGGFG